MSIAIGAGVGPGFMQGGFVDNFVYDADVVIYAATMETSYGGISRTHKRALSTMVTALKAASLWAKIRRMNCIVGKTLSGALYPIVRTAGTAGPDVGVNLVAGDYTSKGIKGNGSNKYFSTGYNSYTDILTDSNCGLSFYSTEDGEQNGYLLGAYADGGYMFSLDTGNRGVSSAYSAGVGGDISLKPYIDKISNIDTRGLISLNVTASGATTYRAGRGLHATPDTTVTGTYLANVENFVLARNVLGSINLPSANTCGFYAFHEGFTPSEAWTFYQIIQQFQADCGRGVTFSGKNLRLFGDSTTEGGYLEGQLDAQAYQRDVELCSNNGIGGQTSDQIAARFAAEPAGKATDGFLLWYGANNITDTAQVLADVTAAVEELEALGNYNYLIMLPIVNSTNPDNYIGGANRAAIEATWSALTALRPGKSYDTPALLAANYDPGTPQDVTDVANGVTPSTLRADAIHLNTAGNGVIANTFAVYLYTTLGW